ncbi:uncharacterized protein LOC118424085 [Branchiostoma floridae]|uniref:Uncharacterized protein LOC118424085 n=1 Tax=Branchiostoma floridae TaxID=7739 RepID=A0A9J7LSS2_BRAFL|nr:uncharacterized protein LOC118424085 [Branchiostoma floridae]
MSMRIASYKRTAVLGLLWITMAEAIGDVMTLEEVTSAVEAAEAWRECPDAETYKAYMTSCVLTFAEDVSLLGNDTRCVWPEPSLPALRPYQRLTDCAKLVGQLTDCRDAVVLNRFMLALHRIVYVGCPRPPEHMLEAPPHIIACFVTLTTTMTIAVAIMLSLSRNPPIKIRRT